MAIIKPRHDPVRLFWRRILSIALLFLVLFGIWAVIGVYQKERESSELRQQSEAQYKDLEAREKVLNARITSLETDRGQEEALRDAYQVGKQGEGVITIVDKPATSSKKSEEGTRNWFQRIFWWW